MHRNLYDEGMQYMATTDPTLCFRENVDRLRNARGMSIQKLGEETGIGRSGMSRIIAGHERVTIERAGRIADALGVELYVLFVESKEKVSA